MNDEKDGLKRDPGLGALVKKARRRSIIRTILIALVISVLVVVGVMAGGKYLLEREVEIQFTSKSLLDDIYGANFQREMTFYNYATFSTTTVTNYTKYIEGVPIPWGEEEIEFPIIGSPDYRSSTHGGGLSTKGAERVDGYVNGNRDVAFFHPEVPYKRLFDDRSTLEKMSDITVAEFAFSFDQAYTEEEVREVFGDSLVWFWVDTFDEETLEGHSLVNETHPTISFIHGTSAFGYKESFGATGFVNSIHSLIDFGKGEHELAHRITNTLTNGENRELTSDDIGIIGVVVTGYADELAQFNDEPMITAATLGVTVEKYIED